MAKTSSKPCAVTGCEKRSRNRGWCSMHYERWRRTGTTESKRLTVEQRFCAKVDQGLSPDECWRWNGVVSTSTGYGVLHVRGKNEGAHRLAYLFATGEDLSGKHIDHTCFNRWCVNPDHLRAVTQRQNNENRNGAQRNSKTGVRGVTEVRGRFTARVQKDGKNHHVGVYASLEDAAEAAEGKRRELFTHSDGR